VRTVFLATVVLVSLTVNPTATAVAAPIPMAPVGPFAGFTVPHGAFGPVGGSRRSSVLCP
jgi:hypothetical protein